MMIKRIRKEILSLYADINLVDKIHIWIRSCICPFERFEPYVPRKGKILDVGCGHGFFVNLMALQSPERYVVGIDPSAAKIKIARKTMHQRLNIDFIQSEFKNFFLKNISAVTIMDVLYLVPFEEQKDMLYECMPHLKNGSLLMIKEICKNNSLQFYIDYLFELIMVKVIRRTFGRGSFYFRTFDDWINLFRCLGYQCKAVRLKTVIPSYLFLCRVMN